MQSRDVPRFYQRRDLMDRMRANSVARSFVPTSTQSGIHLFHAVPTIKDLARVRSFRGESDYLSSGGQQKDTPIESRAPVSDPNMGFVPRHIITDRELEKPRK